MKTLLTSLIIAALTLPGAAQKRGRPIDGEKHIYKEVGDIELPLYVYTPEGHKASDKAPAIVFFFGGGWRSGSPGQFDPHCKHVASKGMVGITVEYRVSSKHEAKIEDCIEDARSAMRWVRSNAKKLGIDPKKVVSGGGSAGGHLGAMVALTGEFDAKTDPKDVNPVPNAMVLFNPALAIAPDDRLPAEYNEAMKTRLASRGRGDMSKVSPLKYADKKQPPCIMFFGTADKLLIGAETFCKASKKAGNDCHIVTYEGQSHGFFNAGRGGGKYYDLTVAEMDKFLAKHGFIKPKK